MKRKIIFLMLLYIGTLLLEACCKNQIQGDFRYNHISAEVYNFYPDADTNIVWVQNTGEVVFKGQYAILINADKEKIASLQKSFLINTAYATKCVLPYYIAVASVQKIEWYTLNTLNGKEKPGTNLSQYFVSLVSRYQPKRIDKEPLIGFGTSKTSQTALDYPWQCPAYFDYPYDVGDTLQFAIRVILEDSQILTDTTAPVIVIQP